MKLLFRISSVFFAALFLSSCVAPAPQLSKEVISSFKRIGVVSVIGSTLERQRVGMTVFGNARESKDIQSWGLDKIYESQIASAAKLVFRGEVVQAEHLTYGLAKANKIADFERNVHSLSWPKWTSLEASIKQYCSANSLDAFLIASFAPGQSTPVFSIFSEGSSSNLTIWASISLVDCASGKRLRESAVGLPDGRGKLSWSISKRISSELSRSVFSEWPASGMDQVRSDLAEMPKSAWEPTLRAFISQSQ
jgi:hypothetical protein